MTLIKCHECGTDVSTEAAACPKCGAPVKKTVSAKKMTGQESTQVVLGLVVVIGISWWIFGSSSDNKPAPTSASNQCTKGDLQCAGDRAISAAGVYCKDPIEKLAKFSVRWKDPGMFETKFSRFKWQDKEAGTLTMVGDKAEFQNGFGAYSPVIYECDLAADGKTVLGARASEGRLP